MRSQMNERHAGARRVAVLAIALGICLLAFPSAALAERTAIISVGCTDSHRLKDDPIVFPGEPGASHLHEFTGSWSTNAFSTLESMRASGHTCELDDTAGYWTPVLYNAQGELIKKRFAAAYFLGNQTNRKYVQPFPAGLKIIVSMQDSYAHGGGWHCGNSSHSLAILSPSTIPNCEGLDDGPEGIYPDITLLEAKLVFPDCWDGVNLDSPDHRSHMAFSDDLTNLCPSSHPVPVPRLNFKNVYDTYGGPGITLSSGGPETMHADFWNTWDQTKLEALVKFCINGSARDTKPPKCSDGRTSLENPNFPDPTPPGGAPFSWPPVLDLNQPSVALTGLSDGETLSGTETVRAGASDGVGVSRVEFLVDIKPQPVKNSSIPIINGVPVAIDHAAPYGFTWDTSCVDNGTHTISARAIDTSGRHDQAVPIEVTVDNPPPQPGQVVCGAGTAMAAQPLVRRCRVFWISRCYRNEKKPSLKKKDAPAKKAAPAKKPASAPHTGH